MNPYQPPIDETLREWVRFLVRSCHFGIDIVPQDPIPRSLFSALTDEWWQYDRVRGAGEISTPADYRRLLLDGGCKEAEVERCH